MAFDQRTVLVTGSSRGIGLAIAKSFLEQGARVIGVSTTRSDAKQLKNENYLHLDLDLSDIDAIKSLYKRIPSKFQNISVLVNNAGIKHFTDFASSTADDWDRTMAVNLRAVYFLSQELSPIIASSGEGRIINIASQSGVAHVRSSIEYGLSKAGVIYLTRSLARALAKGGITVNAVSPGRTYTDMTSYETDSNKLAQAKAKIPLGFINTPEEVANVVLFLASDAAHNITGQILGIDGGECVF